MTTPTRNTPPDCQRRIDDGFVACFDALTTLIRKEFGSIKSARTICRNHNLGHWNKIVQDHGELSALLQQDGGNERQNVNTPMSTQPLTTV